MDFRVRQLQCFLTLADLLNYGKTARVLYMSQPTITFQIQSLEEAFSVKLFERDRKQVRLTQAGESLRTYAQTIMNTISEAQAHLKNLGAPQPLRITCGPAGIVEFLPSVLRTLVRANAGFDVEVVELTSEEQMEQMAERKLDAMIMAPAFPIAGATFTPLCTLPLRAIVSRRSGFAKRTSISVREFDGINVLATRPQDCRFQAPFLHEIFSPYNVSPRLVEVPQSCSVQLAYAAADAGVLVMPHPFGAADFPEVVAIPFKEDLPPIQLGVSVLADNRNEALPLFLQILSHCAARLGPAAHMPRPTMPERSRILAFPQLRDAG